MEIIVCDGNIDRAIQELKKKISRDGIFRRLKEREAFAKPSMRRREKFRAAMRRIRKKQKAGKLN